jgi:hypothetical protein
MRELTPSAATMRSAAIFSPLASVNSPPGVAATPSERRRISTPARRAAVASASIILWRSTP